MNSPQVGVPDYLVSEMDADNFAHLRQTLTDRGKPTVAFVGSGLSRANGYALWGCLIARLAGSVDLPMPDKASYRDPKDYARELQRLSKDTYGAYRDPNPDFRDARFRRALQDFLVEDNHASFHLSHQSLLRINFSAFLTTNYDPSIEMAAKHVEERGCAVCSYMLNRSFSPHYLGTGGIYHIHGRLWNEDGSTATDPIIFLPSEYEVAYGSQERQGVVAQFLKEVMENYHIVFIGFGMRDPVLYSVMSVIAGNNALRQFLEQRRHLGDRPTAGAPVWYRLVGFDDSDIGIARYQCRLDHDNTEEPFTLIHYKYSSTGGQRDEWGLYRLLEDLASNCPHESRDLRGTSVEEARAEIEPPSSSISIPAPVPVTEPSADLETVSVPGDFNQLLERVETILGATQPPDDDIDWVLSQLAEPAVLDFASRFLEAHPDTLSFWFPIFFNARLLSVPPEVIRQGDMLTDPYWYCGRLLMTAAHLGLPLATLALESVGDSGPNGTFLLLRAFAEIRDTDVAARLVPTVVRWLRLWPSLSIDVPAMAHRISSLVEADHLVEAGQLLDALLQQKDQAGQSAGFRTAESRVGEFWFRHMNQQLFPRLGELNAEWLIDCLEVALRRVNEWEYQGNPNYQPPAFLPSPGYRRPVEDAGGEHQPFGDQLVGALRDAIDSLIDTDIEKAKNITSRWLRDRLLVIRRIAIHLLAEHGDLLGDLRQLAVRRENLSLSESYHEFWRFLNSQFQFLPQEQKQQIEDWILSL